MDTKNVVRLDEDGNVIWLNRWRDTAPLWFSTVEVLLLFTVPPLGLLLAGYDIATWWERV